MPRIAALWKQVTDSLWFLPAVITLVGAISAFLLIRIDRSEIGFSPDELWWLFGGGAEGARGVLGAIAGGIITVTGVVFSVTIVALQLTSTQFTPRVLRQFMADRANQLVLGVFIATFTFTLLVQRTVRSGDESGGEFVPAHAVTAALVLALVAIGFLIFFIDHLARSIQAEAIIHRVAHDTLAAIHAFGEDTSVEESPTLPPAETAHVLVAKRAGFLQALDDGALFERAVKHDLVLRIDVPMGGFVLPGQPLAFAWGGTWKDEIQNELRERFVFGANRTPHQDVGLGIIELVDIAVKALSPSINDPTTAMTAIHEIGHVVLEVGRRATGDLHVDSEDGRPRVVRPRLGFASAVHLAFDQLRHFGASNPAVAMRIATVLRTLLTLLPEARHPPLHAQLSLLRSDVEREVQDLHDRARVFAEIETAFAAASAQPSVTRPASRARR